MDNIPSKDAESQRKPGSLRTTTLQRLSIGHRLYILLGAFMLFIVGLVGAFGSRMYAVNRVAVDELSDLMLKAQKDKLRVAVHSIAVSLGSELASTTKSKPEQVATIKALTKDIRFEDDKSGYFFVYEGTVAVSVPATTSAEGTDRKDAKDKNGVYFVRELLAGASQGGAYTTYVYTKPGVGDVPKLAYSEMIPGTPFWVGTGIYIDNIESVKSSVASRLEGLVRTDLFVALAVAALLLVCIMLPFSVMVARSIVRPLQAVKDAAQRVASGDLETDASIFMTFDEVDASRNETVVLRDSFRRVIEYLREVARAAEAVARGDLSLRIEPRSKRDVLSDAMCHAMESLRGVISEAQSLTDAAVAGKLSVRAQAQNFEGAYRKLMEGMNATLDAAVAPLNESVTVLKQIANKDLSQRVRGSYQGDHAQLKDTLNCAFDNLARALEGVSSATKQVAGASGQISSGSQQLAQNASEQASSLEEISASLHEMTSMTQQNASNAQEARTLVAEANTAAADGVRNIQELSESMAKIKASADATAKIVQTIDGIAFQTNLLALNAAVEAARAGDAGKGFAVVADEVRKLAIRSAEAAKHTADLIGESVQNTDSGVEINATVLMHLRQINTRVQRLTEVIDEIAAGSQQQAQGVDQINTAMEQISSATQRTAANAEESAAAGEELLSQTQEMQALVGQFRGIEHATVEPQAVA